VIGGSGRSTTFDYSSGDLGIARTQNPMLAPFRPDPTAETSAWILGPLRPYQLADLKISVSTSTSARTSSSAI
jgi:hypothetical protein